MSIGISNEDKWLAGKITSELNNLGKGYKLQVIEGQRNYGWAVVDDLGNWITANQDLKVIAEKVKELAEAEK